MSFEIGKSRPGLRMYSAFYLREELHQHVSTFSEHENYFLLFLFMRILRVLSSA